MSRELICVLDEPVNNKIRYSNWLNTRVLSSSSQVIHNSPVSLALLFTQSLLLQKFANFALFLTLGPFSHFLLTDESAWVVMNLTSFISFVMRGKTLRLSVISKIDWIASKNLQNYFYSSSAKIWEQPTKFFEETWKISQHQTKIRHRKINMNHLKWFKKSLLA